MDISVHKPKVVHRGQRTASAGRYIQGQREGVFSSAQALREDIPIEELHHVVVPQLIGESEVCDEYDVLMPEHGNRSRLFLERVYVYGFVAQAPGQQFHRETYRGLSVSDQQNHPTMVFEQDALEVIRLG
jgi:hypothetical protein